MYAASSPINYPATSSPVQTSPRKRRKISEARGPLQDLDTNCLTERRAGFFHDSDNDEDDAVKFRAQKPKGQKGETELNFSQMQGKTNTNLVPNSRYDILAFNKDIPQTSSHLLYNQSLIASGRSSHSRKNVLVQTCSGKTLSVSEKETNMHLTYERMIAARSTVVLGQARRSYYGIDIHNLIDECSREKVEKEHAQKNAPFKPETSEVGISALSCNTSKLLWTEKYRARRFTDLVGDERTHRSVLRWIKGWDHIVFPCSSHSKLAKSKKPDDENISQGHRKVLLITGPPGLGKTTLAHVCAKQAGYEVHEINASDERSRDIVRGKIRDMVCTENIRPASSTSIARRRKLARPVCVIVDEVDGVVAGGNNGGDGGFVKTLVELLLLDQKTSSAIKRHNGSTEIPKKKRGDNFRILRPLILICNDLYHPSLRLLRHGNMAEIVHVRKPSLQMIIPRLHSIFEQECIPCDNDGIRQLCEATWGVSTKKEDRSIGSTGEGDMRSILVVAEWTARKLRSESQTNPNSVRLTKKWLEQNVLDDLMYGGGAARAVGRGSSKEIVEKVFSYNAGFSSITQVARSAAGTSSMVGVAEAAKDRAMQRLKAMIDSSGEDEHIMTDCFSSYPSRPFQDDNFLSKPCLAHDWLHFHDTLSNLVQTSQEWELVPYLSSPILAFHHLFASTSAHSYQDFVNFSYGNENEQNDSTPSTDQIPFSGPRASFEAYEARKAALAALTQLQSQLCLPLLRSFRSPIHLSTDLLPYVLRILDPDIKPVVVGGSEKGIASVRRGPERELVLRAVNAMIACGIRFDRSKVEGELPSQSLRSGSATTEWIYRMEPPLDNFGVYATTTKNCETNTGTNKVRFATRQVLEQEREREIAKRDQAARVKRATASVQEKAASSLAPVLNFHNVYDTVTETQPHTNSRVKRDFFGRAICMSSSAEPRRIDDRNQARYDRENIGQAMECSQRTWVTYHEGFSNAVRKGITLKELLHGL